MPSPIAHGMISLSIYSLYNRNFVFKNIKGGKYNKLILYILLLSILPDIDFLGVYLVNNDSIHGGLTHSITFAFIICLIIKATKFRLLPVFFCFIIIIGHTIIDMCTINGYYPGTKQILWPFSENRYTFNKTFGFFNSLDWADSKSFYSILTLFSLVKEIFIGITIYSVIVIFRNGYSNLLKKPDS